MRFRLSCLRVALLALGLAFAISFGVAQSADVRPANGALTSHVLAATIDKPVIDKIDPPDWWARMPNPMLLVHGRGLAAASFHVAGTGVALTRTQISANGHWVFLWLHTGSAPAQTLQISAHTDAGDAHASYVLARREERPKAHAGLQNSDVLYLIMPDRFADAAPNPPGIDRTAMRGWHGGDLAGIEQHLDYLRDLGVTAIWTNPVLSNGATPESYHGYAATDLYAIDPHFGVPGSYRHLADALHARNMKLVMDLVPNHVSVLHPWIEDPPAPEWLHGSREHHLAVQFDLRKLVDPHAPPQAWLPITTGWFTDAMPDLNQENPLVRQYLIQNALWWMETAGLDGFRLDTFQYVSRDFWRDFHTALHSLYPHVTTVGETLDGDAEVVSFFAGGVTHSGIDTGLDTPFDYPLNFALRDVFAEDKPMTELARILRQDELYPHPERLVTFLDNHDTERFFTTVHGSLPKFKLALGLLFTLRGTPQMYSGDEIAMPGGNDPDNRRDFPGGFPGDPRNAFTAAGRTADENSVYRWTSALLAWRKSHPSITEGLEQNLFASDAQLAFLRTTSAAGCASAPAAQRVLVVVNKSTEAKTIEFATDSTALAGCGSFVPLAATPGATPLLTGNVLRIELQPSTLAILEVH
ncbi:MAG: alpha-amylase family glycosyl hydrolase [Terracidiphilus sp.]|nr:alpha-amylase family glycosyl hydrolase [Terracidiphilus sp.]